MRVMKQQDGKILISLSNDIGVQKALEKAGVTNLTTVKNLSVTGTFNHTHFSDIFKLLNGSLQELDLSGAHYDAYFVKKDDFFSYYRKEHEKYHQLWSSEFCDTLVSISFPDSVTELMPEMFWRFKNLAAITVTGDHPNYAVENGILFNKDKTKIVRFPTGYKGEYIIAGTVVEIGEHAFRKCKGLTSVVIPQSLEKIGEYAFFGCEGLLTINFPPSAAIIEAYVFAYCSRLTSFVIPDSIVEIGNQAFGYCAGLTSVVIPMNVGKIGEDAFSQCTNLKSVQIINPAIKLGHHAFYGCTALTSLDMPKSVKYKQNCVFDYCTNLPLYIALQKEDEINTIKQVKIKRLKETSAYEWVDTLMKNSVYPYKIIKQSTKLQLLVLINEKQKLVIPVPIKNFQTVIPKILDAISRFEAAINEFGIIYIDNMINDNRGWIISHLPQARQKELIEADIKT